MTSQQPEGWPQQPVQPAPMPPGRVPNGERLTTDKWWRPGVRYQDDQAQASGQQARDMDVTFEKRQEALRREARRAVDREEAEEAFGKRELLSWDQLAALPKPRDIVPGVLTAGVYGMAGPTEAGKSLMMRDNSCTLASRGHPVVYCPSEGSFDMEYRFESHPLFAAAQPHLTVLPEGRGLMLSNRGDVDWMIAHCSKLGAWLIIFDMIYGFGIADDNTVAGIAPVLGGCRRLATAVNACVMITGHPGLNGARRFRGSSMWRGALDGEFHMADGRYSCEKHKYADKAKIGFSYTVEYPHLRHLGDFEAIDRAHDHEIRIREDLRLYRFDTDVKRARRLSGPMGLSEDHLRKLIRRVKKEVEDES